MYNGFRHSFLPWSLNLVTLNIFHLWACGPEVHHLHLTIWGLPPPLSLQEESVCICVLCHISGLHNPPSGTWPSGGHLPPWGPAGLRPPTVSAPELSCPLKWGQAFHPLHFYLMTAWSLICTIFSLSLSFASYWVTWRWGAATWRSAPKGHNFYEHRGCLTFISWANMPEGVSPRPLIDKICSPDNWRKLERRSGGGEGMRSRGKCP